jgi:hypothetical protein
MEDTVHLEDSITTLAELQEQIAQLESRREKRYGPGKELLAIEEQVSELKAHAKKLDSQIRDHVVVIYESTGQRHPHPAVGIRVYTKLRYDTDEALHWSQHHLHAALKLNKRFFEKHARAVAETQPIPFVTIEESPSATISIDLSEYVGG